MKNILCIVNPVSGLKKSLKVYYEVENTIKDHGFSPVSYTHLTLPTTPYV